MPTAEESKDPLNPLARRVVQLMKERNVSGRKLAKAIERSPSYVSTITSGKTKVPDTDTISALSSYFDEDLLKYIGMSQEQFETLAMVYFSRPSYQVKVSADQPAINAAIEAESRQVAIQPKTFLRSQTNQSEALPLVGIVEAGAWRAREEFGDVTDRIVELIRDPRFPKARQEAHEVRGDSMNRAGFFEGGFVRMIHLADAPISLRTGMVVVVERRLQQGGLVERTLKAVEIGDSRIYRLCPRSTNPKHEVIEIDSTADLLDETAEVAVLGFVTAYINPVPY